MQTSHFSDICEKHSTLLFEEMVVFLNMKQFIATWVTHLCVKVIFGCL